jgi:hypothetical protein
MPEGLSLLLQQFRVLEKHKRNTALPLARTTESKYWMAAPNFCKDQEIHNIVIDYGWSVCRT